MKFFYYNQFNALFASLSVVGFICFTDAVIVGSSHAKNTVNNASGIFGMAGRKTFRQHSNSI